MNSYRVACTYSHLVFVHDSVSQSGDVKALELLLRVSGCLETLRLADDDGNLPLHIACQSKHANIVRTLLREDPSVIETANRCDQLYEGVMISLAKLIEGNRVSV